MVSRELLGPIPSKYSLIPLTKIPVVARATASPPDANALKALGIHYKFLMRVAQTLCVITQAKGVLLAGDNQVRTVQLPMSDY